LQQLGFKVFSFFNGIRIGAFAISGGVFWRLRNGGVGCFAVCAVFAAIKKGLTALCFWVFITIITFTEIFS
jgi:hypothetical protein